MAEVKPKYYKFHRVFCTKKHVNGTVIRSVWSEKANDFIYEINLDNGEKKWFTRWSLNSEDRIKYFIGSSAHSLTHNQNCEIVDIIGYSSQRSWLMDVRLESGEVVRVGQDELTHYKSLSLRKREPLPVVEIGE